MAEGERATYELSARRIVGFACVQTFAFFLLYSGVRGEIAAGDSAASLRVDALVALAAIVIGFLGLRLAKPSGVDAIISRPLLYAHGGLAAGSALIVAFVPDPGWYWSIAAGVLAGVPYALLLTAWGRSFASTSTTNAVPEVFLGSLVAALLCFLLTLFEASSFLVLAVGVLPLVSVVNVEIPERLEGDSRMPAVIDAQSEPARELSARMLAGAFLFGLAVGVGAFSFVGRAENAVGFQVGMILFGAYLIGGLTLLLSRGFGRGESLSKSYRLAVFVMMVGILVMSIPLGDGDMPFGQSALLAGFLGLEAVLVSLFIVMAEITASDCAHTLSSGLASLFAGGFAGVVLAGSALSLIPAELQGSVALVVSGVFVLVAYVFLFTERDFSLLSEIVSAGDTFEEICDSITKEYRLSKRESEILMYALRGRTSERIAQELVIAKSTVDTHLRRIYAKCNVHSRQELLDLAERKR